MADIKLEGLSPAVVEKTAPFLAEVINNYSENIHSVYIVGSAVTADYNEKTSDINSIFVLKKMDLRFIEVIAPLGKRYKKKGVAAPLIMTPEYIMRSVDVFPVEFHDFKLIHQTVFGEDILNGIDVRMTDLRHQCEREIKSKLIGLVQAYIASQGDRRILTERFMNLITGYMPLFRGIIMLMGKKPPILKNDVISELSAATGINADIFRRILDIKRGRLKLTKDVMNTVFEEYYETTERIGKVIDDLQV
ncbi:MAG: hypothetical protein A3J81_08335 [Nitrospirae bacterium RIFOXYB2_FULL_43_5]|nr:MAG: hypothetical protein A2X54_00955 [Nitrospirae bacterium GWF2_44_13]OGW31253.1 MAG: hypothetical protein A2088_01525 [Nitrospirae bacterium GWD2_44_7]OGW66441.1 MAG: hypothetical protein A2222_08790 [Nitrospirae bacterium RIFOXYA2_FULL_44_9]OGW74411.1 MAG: hypothetical protein A2484_05425 [Nitrospirae bacterium RIFOXYC2_FULL_44_7]OGW78132.1 MAG: hypothetical protein A3J81_08335 [Nitrospirae bacterium RIFOXYB2_FULL_43_5]HBG92235.1 hypothetical protein [Nitrospiraceae bacterium]